MRNSLMVRCQAHNLETVIACVGSTPTSATNFSNMEKRLLSAILDTSREMCDFVNEHNIHKDDVVNITTTGKGSYVIFYYK